MPAIGTGDGAGPFDSCAGLLPACTAGGLASLGDDEAGIEVPLEAGACLSCAPALSRLSTAARVDVESVVASISSSRLEARFLAALGLRKVTRPHELLRLISFLPELACLARSTAAAPVSDMYVSGFSSLLSSLLLTASRLLNSWTLTFTLETAPFAAFVLFRRLRRQMPKAATPSTRTATAAAAAARAPEEDPALSLFSRLAPATPANFETGEDGEGGEVDSTDVDIGGDGEGSDCAPGLASGGEGDGDGLADGGGEGDGESEGGGVGGLDTGEIGGGAGGVRACGGAITTMPATFKLAASVLGSAPAASMTVAILL